MIFRVSKSVKVFLNIHIRIQIFIILFISPLNLYSQLRYPVVGTYKGKSAQGMAIWKDSAYLFNDGGHCRVLNLKTGKVTRDFDLASAGKNTHVNAACFGKETLKEGTIPVIYISEYKSPSRCFVENIGDSVCTLLQTIRIVENRKNIFVQSWIVDNNNGFIYAIAREAPLKGEKNSDKVKISKYRLPQLSEGTDIVFTEKDCIDTFVVNFASGTQGGIIKGRYMYLPTGLQESARGQFNAERAIQVIDLKKKRLTKRIDLSLVTTNEPEDMDFYKGKALLYCGQEGGLYKVRL